MVAPCGTHSLERASMTFAKAINSNSVEAKVQKALDIINDACRQNPDNPRDAGVKDPAKFIAHPLKLVKVEVEDRDTGTLTVDSAWGRKTVEFSADDSIQEFVDGELLEALAG